MEFHIRFASLTTSDKHLLIKYTVLDSKMNTDNLDETYI